jgi:hypothetical protein
MEEITEEAAELVARVASATGKASLTACVRVPHEVLHSLARDQRHVLLPGPGDGAGRGDSV